ncbi:hypothetical protein GQ53DRAFT_708740 [Thozetella sp. PMI_491]|nr:hypothetical protein GQ53DRAFT_708740 [Thozetella sp. PMI_491]
MAMAPLGLLESFLAAIQASLSVLLVIFYGAVAGKFGLLSNANTKPISKMCVRAFLPALLITQIGSELHPGSATRYLIVFAWAIICHLISFLIGVLAHLLFGMPDWVTVALMFNNTTSYPLLLIEALDETGILSSLIVTDETTKAAIERAKSYFLVFATVSSCLTFAVGPRLIDSEHAPEPAEEDKDDNDSAQNDSEEPQRDVNEETGLLAPRTDSAQFINPFPSSRRNSFFPSTRKLSTIPSRRTSVDRRASFVPKRRWTKLSPRLKWWLLFLSDFFNAPLLGAAIGVAIGLTPPLHRAFFNNTEDGGIFTAWLTASLKTIGSLFVPLPVVVAGVSLYSSMKATRESHDSQRKLPWVTVLFILFVRFALWPVLSIFTVYFLASNPDLLPADPILWFALMLMPTGPPAMKLITLIQVSDGGEEDEANISKILTISYLISPILSLTVVGSLIASQYRI